METGWRSGPRQHRPPSDPDPGYYDPKRGGCMNCGDKVGVMQFALVRKGKPAGRWNLCEPCYLWGQGGLPPLDPDPRQAEAA